MTFSQRGQTEEGSCYCSTLCTSATFSNVLPILYYLYKTSFFRLLVIFQTSVFVHIFPPKQDNFNISHSLCSSLSLSCSLSPLFLHYFQPALGFEGKVVSTPHLTLLLQALQGRPGGHSCPATQCLHLSCEGPANTLHLPFIIFIFNITHPPRPPSKHPLSLGSVCLQRRDDRQDAV